MRRISAQPSPTPPAAELRVIGEQLKIKGFQILALMTDTAKYLKTARKAG